MTPSILGKSRNNTIIIPQSSFADTEACVHTEEGLLLRGKAIDATVFFPLFCFQDTQACVRTKAGHGLSMNYWM